MSDLLGSLERLYQNLEAALPRADGNPCGQCYECCTGAGLSRHRVSELELGYLRDRVGPERLEEFRQYAERGRGEDGELRFPVCPYYNSATHRCTVYAFRPFSCRVFGHFRADSTEMPQACVFRGREKVFEPRHYLDRVPLARELRQLMRAWEPNPMHAVRYVKAEEATAQLPDALDLAFLDPDDPVDRAIQKQVKGDWEGARDELLLARRQWGDLPHIMQHLGTTLEMSGDHAAARDVFLTLIQRQPDNAVFHYHVGVNDLSLGDADGALRNFQRTFELNPQHALAIGFVGYLHVMAGRLDEGVAALTKAVALDPENGFFRLRLGLAHLSCGQLPEGLVQLREATRFAETRDLAEAVLRGHEC